MKSRAQTHTGKHHFRNIWTNQMENKLIKKKQNRSFERIREKHSCGSEFNISFYLQLDSKAINRNNKTIIQNKMLVVVFFVCFMRNISWRDHLCIASTSCWPTYCDSASKRAYQRNNLQLLLNVHSVHIIMDVIEETVCSRNFFWIFPCCARCDGCTWMNGILCEMNGAWLPKQSLFDM